MAWMTFLRINRFGVVALALFIALNLANAGDARAGDHLALKVSFADPSWNGQKIPKGQHCRKFGGNGATPPLTIENIPGEANAIIVEFNDSSYRPLSYDGGHGKVGFWIKSGHSVATLKTVAGGTKIMPEGVFLVAKNRAGGGWYSEGYLPPCSGGRGNLYVAVVKAVVMNKDADSPPTVLATGRISLGRY